MIRLLRILLLIILLLLFGLTYQLGRRSAFLQVMSRVEQLERAALLLEKICSPEVKWAKLLE